MKQVFYDKKHEKLRNRQARWVERVKKLVDLRVCMSCRHAFISRSGHNICSDCLCSLFPPNMRQRTVKRLKIFLQKKGFQKRFFRWTTHPALMIPDSRKDAMFYAAVNRTFEKMRLSHETGQWIVDQMPKIEGIGPIENPIPMREKCRRVS